ncbi:amidase [Neptuniibacter sp.]|uniref:amidase n=1 Tax=Neptuniibacter sp. TaxID=1962643 RepID=UPI00260846AA|nr:amidase [Neptuniibacter sp.]
MCVLVQQFSDTGDCHAVNGGHYAVAVKDSIDVAGSPTVAGSPALADAAPAETNAAVVQALLDANCKLAGKTTMHELAFGMTGLNEWAGTPVNHRFPDFIPGGSSSGSAVAVANSLADFSLGTDTGGSIRVPATCCGVFGFKPTFGRVSREGVQPEQTTLDCVGPFADSAEVLIEAMRIIDSSFKPVQLNDLSGVNFGLVNVKADSVIWAAVYSALHKADVDPEHLSLPGMDAAFRAGMSLISRETWQAFGDLVATGKLGADVESRLKAASQVADTDITEAELVRSSFTREVDQLLEQVDLLVMPTLPTFPMLLSDAKAGKTDLNISALVRPFNLSGHPALSIPLLAKGGRPAGLQLIGRKGEDELVCEVARLIGAVIPKVK